MERAAVSGVCATTRAAATSMRWRCATGSLCTGTGSGHGCAGARRSWLRAGVAWRGAVRWDERGTHAPAHALASLGRLPPPPSACVQQKWTVCGACDLMREGRCGAAGGMRGRRGRSGGPQQSCAAARTAPPRLRRLRHCALHVCARANSCCAQRNAGECGELDKGGPRGRERVPLAPPRHPHAASPRLTHPALLCAPPRPARLAHLRGDRFCTPIRATPKLPKRQYLLGGS